MDVIGMWKQLKCIVSRMNLHQMVEVGMFTFYRNILPIGMNLHQMVEAGMFTFYRNILPIGMNLHQMVEAGMFTFYRNILPRNFNKSLKAIWIQWALHFQRCYPFEFFDIIHVDLHHHKIQKLIRLTRKLRVRDCPHSTRVWRSWLERSGWSSWFRLGGSKNGGYDFLQTKWPNVYPPPPLNFVVNQASILTQPSASWFSRLCAGRGVWPTTDHYGTRNELGSFGAPQVVAWNEPPPS